MKMVLGNALFGLLVLVWRSVCDNNREMLFKGILFIAATLILGICIGAALNAPKATARKRNRARATVPAFDADVFSQIH